MEFPNMGLICTTLNLIHVQGPLSGLSSDYAETNALQLPLSESTCTVVLPIKEWGRFNMAVWS